MSARYTPFIQFGQAYNKNIKNPLSSANPLTYCMYPTLNSQFFHGSASGGLLYGNQNSACFAFMADRCEKSWDGFCEAYARQNRDTYWPNLGSVDTEAYENAKRFLRIRTSVGDDLIRNSVYRRFIRVPNQVVTREPFDPTVANSPSVTLYDNYVDGYSQVVGLDGGVDEDPHVRLMLQHPSLCFDVLGRIALAVRRGEPGINIGGSRLEEFLNKNPRLLDEYLEQAVALVPSFQAQNSQYVNPCYAPGQTTDQS